MDDLFHFYHAIIPALFYSFEPIDTIVYLEYPGPRELSLNRGPEMLELVVPKSEQYDDDSGCFITTKEQTLRLEHSLVSLSKWEAKWHKPYLSTTSAA